jgi:phage-related protein
VLAVIDALWYFHHNAIVAEGEKPLRWVGTSKEDLRAFPDDVKDVMGYALHLARQGGKHDRPPPESGRSP